MDVCNPLVYLAMLAGFSIWALVTTWRADSKKSEELKRELEIYDDMNKRLEAREKYYREQMRIIAKYSNRY